MDSIYGAQKDLLPLILQEVRDALETTNAQYKEEHGEALYEHLNGRVKDEESMREKCRRKGLPETSTSALEDIKDAIGLRVTTAFIDDIYAITDLIRDWDNVTVVKEKDYIAKAKPSGYRSYHMILKWTGQNGAVKGQTFFVEIQIRTIAMDCWAALEHQINYKKDIQAGARELLRDELKRCADEIASCDLSMQTLRRLLKTM